MTSQNRVKSQLTASVDRAERALRELDDPLFSDVVVRELRRRSSFAGVAGQVERTMNAGRARVSGPLSGPIGVASIDSASRRATVPSGRRRAAMQVPHVCSTEASEILVRRGVLPESSAADALRTFARAGRLIVLRGDRRWVYPRFQLDYFDPRDPNNVICVVNRTLDAGHYPELVTSWWISPSNSLPGRRAPVELLGEDHTRLRQFAAAYAAESVGA